MSIDDSDSEDSQVQQAQCFLRMARTPYLDIQQQAVLALVSLCSVADDRCALGLLNSGVLDLFVQLLKKTETHEDLSRACLTGIGNLARWPCVAAKLANSCATLAEIFESVVGRSLLLPTRTATELIRTCEGLAPHLAGLPAHQDILMTLNKLEKLLPSKLQDRLEAVRFSLRAVH